MKWKINQAAMTRAGLGFMLSEGGSLLRVMHPERSDVIDLRASDGAAELLPERSSGHKAVADALGLSE